MSRIFINYRRSTSRYAAEMLRQLCAVRFGRNFVFFDTEAVLPGEHFPDRVIQALSRCEVFLPLIGPKWHEVEDENGTRLHHPNDWVRREIATVLARNKDRPADGPSPVLVIPLLEAGASIPSADLLPDDLKPLSDLNAVHFLDFNDLEMIADRIEEHLGSPPMGEFGMRVLHRRLDRSRQDQHRFRFVRSQKDLEPFVELSDAEVVIAGANPGLSGSSRRELYENWCQATALNERLRWYDPENKVKSFLILDQKQLDGEWLPIGVSILLPLSVEGGRHLRLLRSGKQLLSAKRNASTLEAGDLVHGPSNCLLLDTWIIRRRDALPNETTSRVNRFNHHNWGIGLVLRHVGEYWDPDSGLA